MAEADVKDLEEKMRSLAVTATNKSPTEVNWSQLKKGLAFLDKNGMTVAESGVFPKVVTESGSKKQAFALNKKNCDMFFTYLAQKLVAKKRGKKDSEVPVDDRDVQKEKKQKCDQFIAYKASTSGTKVCKASVVDRMTDTSKYTGAHKERFDAKGKGKGAAGRVDKVDDSGYVGNYRGAGTYDEKK